MSVQTAVNTAGLAFEKNVKRALELKEELEQQVKAGHLSQTGANEVFQRSYPHYAEEAHNFVQSAKQSTNQQSVLHNIQDRQLTPKSGGGFLHSLDNALEQAASPLTLAAGVANPFLGALGSEGQGLVGEGVEAARKAVGIPSPSELASQVAGQLFTWLKEWFGDAIVRGLLYAVLAGGGLVLAVHGLTRTLGIQQPTRKAARAAAMVAAA